MAGDWIKMRHNLSGDPAVLQLADILHATDIDLIIGKLHRFWSWASENTTDGRLPEVLDRRIDHVVNQQGFAEAMCKVGWLLRGKNGLKIPKFDRHMSSSAKGRAGDATRKALVRKNMRSKMCPDKSPDICPDKSRTRVEAAESRGEKSTEHASSKEPTPHHRMRHASGDAALPTDQAREVCTMLLRAVHDGSRLFSLKAATAIAQHRRASAMQVTWALERLHDASRLNTIKNPSGFVRELIQEHDPPQRWREQFGRRELAKFALAEAVQAERQESIEPTNLKATAANAGNPAVVAGLAPTALGLGGPGVRLGPSAPQGGRGVESLRILA